MMGTAMKVTTERRQDNENMNINEPKSIVTLRQNTFGKKKSSLI